MEKVLYILEKDENIGYNLATHGDLEKISFFSSEKEVLFFPFSSFEIQSLNYINNNNIYEIKLIYLGKYLTDIKNDYNITEYEKNIPSSDFKTKLLGTGLIPNEKISKLNTKSLYNSYKKYENKINNNIYHAPNLQNLNNGPVLQKKIDEPKKEKPQKPKTDSYSNLKNKNQIFVKSYNEGNNIIYSLDVELYYTIEKIKSMIQDKNGIPSYNQKLFFKSKELVNNLKLSDYSINYNSTILLIFNNNKMTIFVKIYQTNFQFIVQPTDDVYKLKCMIQDKKGYTTRQQSLVFQSKRLEDSKLFADYDIYENSILHLTLLLFGG